MTITVLYRDREAGLTASLRSPTILYRSILMLRSSETRLWGRRGRTTKAGLCPLLTSLTTFLVVGEKDLLVGPRRGSFSNFRL
jgi:hypothetical protein